MSNSVAAQKPSLADVSLATSGIGDCPAQHLRNALMTLNAIESRHLEAARNLLDESPSPARERHEALVADLKSVRDRVTKALCLVEPAATFGPMDMRALADAGFRL